MSKRADNGHHAAEATNLKPIGDRTGGIDMNRTGDIYMNRIALAVKSALGIAMLVPPAFAAAPAAR